MATEKERQEHLVFAEWYEAQFGKRPQPVLDDDQYLVRKRDVERLAESMTLFWKRCIDYDDRRDACMKAWYAAGKDQK